MKIGILTVPFNNNYGGFLQAYALTTVLRKMGHEVVIINRRRNLSLKTKIRKLLTFGIQNRNEKIIEKLSENTNRFVSDNLEITSPLFSSRALRKECKRQRFNCLIVGSDQVWRYKYAKKSIEDYYFGFLKSGDKTPRFSYAASIGVDFQEYPLKTAVRCGKLLKKFRSVSVREKSAVKLLEQHFVSQKEKIVVVIDPTLLLEQKDYHRLTNRYSIETKCDYLFKYVLDEEVETERVCEILEKRLQLPSRQIRAQTGSLSKLKVIEPVERWLSEIANASFVVTDSYHGVVFSILFNRPFVVVTNEMRGATRIAHLLSHFHLTARMMSAASTDVIAETINTPINWNFVNEQLLVDRASSLDFIERNLLFDHK